MPQHHQTGRNLGDQGRATPLRAALGVAVVSLVVGLGAPAASAADDDSFLYKVMRTLGLSKSPDADPGAKYSERSPLVVPPNRDLPPPSAEPPPAPDWPKEPTTVRQPKRAKGKVVPVQASAPVADGTATAASGNANPAPVTEQPPTPKKSFFDLNWFNTEEYAKFTGEPARETLTDPPAGYRTPSPNEPYGIGPEKKAKTKTAGDGTPIQTGTQTATPTQTTPTAAQPNAAPGLPAPTQ